MGTSKNAEKEGNCNLSLFLSGDLITRIDGPSHAKKNKARSKNGKCECVDFLEQKWYPVALKQNKLIPNRLTSNGREKIE